MSGGQPDAPGPDLRRMVGLVRYQRVGLAAIGYELPPKVLSSAAIEDRLSPVYQRIGLLPGRLELMTGIVERRYWDGVVRPSAVAARAGERALAGFDRGKIGALVHASVCRDFLEPATANVVHHTLGLPKTAQVYDVSNACLGVLSAMLQVANQIELGQIEAGLVVAGENGRPLVDSTIQHLLQDPTIDRRSIKPHFASLTIGSGAVAVLLTRQEDAPHRLRGATIRAATEHHTLCQGGVEGGDTGVGSGSSLGMTTDSEALLKAGITLAKDNWVACQEGLGFGERAPERVLTHQVGKAHQQQLYQALGIDEAKSFITYDKLGNVGSVSLPITLALAAEAGFVNSGDGVALLGIGSGLSSVMMGVDW